MLTDAALKHLRPKEKIYKVTDRDGMYVLMKPSGPLTFRLDYRMNGRRETVMFGKYGPAGLSLARARELCIDAKRAIAEGRSPAIEKQREKCRLLEAKSFGEFGEKWLTAAPMAESTRAMRRSLSPTEIRIMLKLIEKVATLPTIRLGMRLYADNGAQERTSGCDMG